jgi:predicted MFS family arabinose efflux permease
MEAPVSTMHPSSNPEDQPRRPSRASLRGLDWFTFFVADIQTSFGPFIAVYLTTQKWTLADIGLVLTIGGLVSLIGQMPGGAVVDAVRSERRAAAWAVAGIGVSALVLALWPIFIIVVAVRVLHAASSCVLGPALAAISLGLVGHAAIGERLGRNARFASVGNGLSAAVMGAVGYLLSSSAVFFVAAALAIPALASLFRIRADEIDP